LTDFSRSPKIEALAEEKIMGSNRRHARGGESTREFPEKDTRIIRAFCVEPERAIPAGAKRLARASV